MNRRGLSRQRKKKKKKKKKKKGKNKRKEGSKMWGGHFEKESHGVKHRISPNVRHKNGHTISAYTQ